MSVLARFSRLYDRLFTPALIHWVEKVTLYIAIAGFLVHLGIIYLENHFDMFRVANAHPPSYLQAIYTPFSFLLFFEVFLLVTIIPKSTSEFVGKQFEIISLITLRSFFHDISEVDLGKGHDFEWEGIKSVALDLAAALAMFGLTIAYYRISKPPRAEDQDPGELARFVSIKKIISGFLVLVLVVVSTQSLVAWYVQLLESLQGKQLPPNPDTVFYGQFFSIVIFVDVFLLIVSMLYRASFELLFRNAAFVITTILLRFSLGMESPFNHLLVLGGFLFSMTALALYAWSTKPVRETVKGN